MDFYKPIDTITASRGIASTETKRGCPKIKKGIPSGNHKQLNNKNNLLINRN